MMISRTTSLAIKNKNKWLFRSNSSNSNDKVLKDKITTEEADLKRVENNRNTIANAIKSNKILNLNNNTNDSLSSIDTIIKATKNDINDKLTVELSNVNKDHELMSQFKLWHKANNRDYPLDSNEANKRFKIFKQNYNFINKQNNSNYNSVKEEKGYALGLGPFADMDFDEFRAKILRKKPNGELGKLIDETINNNLDQE